MAVGRGELPADGLPAAAARRCLAEAPGAVRAALRAGPPSSNFNPPALFDLVIYRRENPPALGDRLPS